MKKVLSFARMDFDLTLKLTILLNLITGVLEVICLRGCLIDPSAAISTDGVIYYTLNPTQIGNYVDHSPVFLIFLLGFLCHAFLALFYWNESKGSSHMRYTTFRTGVKAPYQTLGFTLSSLWRLGLFWILHTLVIYGCLGWQIRTMFPESSLRSVIHSLMVASFSSPYLHSLIPLKDPMKLLIVVLLILVYASVCGDMSTSLNSFTFSGSATIGGLGAITHTMLRTTLVTWQERSFALVFMLGLLGIVWYLNISGKSPEKLYSTVKGSINNERSENDG